MSSKKLLEQCQKLEKLWNHVFTATITLANITQENQWYNKLTDMIDKQQTAPIWMSDAKVNKNSENFSYFCKFLYMKDIPKMMSEFQKIIGHVRSFIWKSGLFR